ALRCRIGLARAGVGRIRLRVDLANAGLVLAGTLLRLLDRLRERRHLVVYLRIDVIDAGVDIFLGRARGRTDAHCNDGHSDEHLTHILILRQEAGGMPAMVERPLRQLIGRPAWYALRVRTVTSVRRRRTSTGRHPGPADSNAKRY